MAKAKASASEKAVVTAPKNEVSNVDTALLREQASGKGVSTDVADNVTPLLKVLQALSPQVIKQKPEYIKGAEAGNIYALGSKEVWDGDEGVRVVPCYYERVWMEWGPKLGDGLKGRHRDGKDETPVLLGAEQREDSDGKTKWFLPNGNILQDTREHVVLLLDKLGDPTPFVLSMTSSNIGTSRRWHPIMNKKKSPSGKKKAASYEFVYQFTSIPKTKDQFSWFQMAIDDLDERTSDAVFLLADKINADFSGGVLTTDVDTDAAPVQRDNDEDL